jgi:hypothetical protein
MKRKGGRRIKPSQTRSLGVRCTCLHEWVDQSMLDKRFWDGCCNVGRAAFTEFTIPNRLHGAAINAEGDAI